jgi:hypothetical protein
MNLQYMKWEGVDWIDLAKDRQKWRAFVKAVMKSQFPKNERNFLNS